MSAREVDQRGAAGRLTGLAALAAAWSVLLARRGWFAEDDLWNLQVGAQLGWGWDLLGRDVLGHVSPGFNALVWLVTGPGGGRWGVALATIAALTAAVPPSVAASARALGATPRRACWAAAASTAMVSMATAWAWWTAALVILPSLLASAWAVVGVGWARSGRRDGAWVTAIALSLGVLFSEGVVAVLVLPAAMALLDGGARRGSRLVRAWGPPGAWAIAASPLAIALVVRASAATPPSHQPRPGLWELVAFPFAFVFRGVPTVLVGLAPNRFELPGPDAITVVVASVLLVLVWTILRPRLRADAGRWIVAVLAVVLARGAIVAWGRLAVLGWGDAVEVRYLADLVWLVPVVLAARWRSAPEPGDAPRARRRRAQQARAVGVVGCVAVAGLVGQVLVVERAPARGARRYRERLVASWTEQPARTSVLDVTVPSAILGPQFGGYAFLSRTFDRDGLALRFAPADRVVAPDAQGDLREVSLGALASLLPDEAFTAIGAPVVAHERGCWVARDELALVWVPLDRPVRLGPYVLVLELGGPSSTGVGVESAGMAPQSAIGTSPVGRGERRWVISTLPFAASQIGFSIPSGGRLCLASGVVATPVPT